jgi:hypothetical protein
MTIHFWEETSYIFYFFFINLFFFFLMKWEGTMAPFGPLLVPSLNS